MQHQVHGVQWLLGQRHAMLGWDMGVGKTAALLRAWEETKRLRWSRPGQDPLLVFCLASARENWAREAARFCHTYPSIQVLSTVHDKPHPDADVVITNYDKLLRADFKAYLTTKKWGAIILDEAHVLKNPDAKRTKAIYGADDQWAKQRIPLINCAHRVWLATGTPTPNHPGELYSHARALWPERIEYKGHTMAQWEFEAAFCEIANTQRGPKIIGARNMAELHERLDPVVSRVRRKDVLDLPPIRIDSWPLDVDTMSGLQLPQSDEARTLLGTLVERYGDLSQLDLAASEVVDAYLSCINSNVHVMAQARQQTATLKASATAIMLREEMEASGEQRKKTVIFAHHREAIAVLEKHLAPRGTATIHGGIAPTARQGIIDRFQEDPLLHFFIGQITAAGSSVNIQGASDVVFVESSWVPGENEQAIARVYRHGQVNPVRVRYVYLPGSIDEAVNRAIARKMSMRW